jgi:hypothetical protein
LLPKDISEFPIKFGDQHLKLLQGSLFLDQLEEDRKEIKHNYEMICSEVPEFKDECTLDEFIYNFILILSRVFSMVIEGKKTKGMLPLIDMPNHSYQNNLKWTFSEAEKGFMIAAQDDIARGEELSINYGV